MIKRKLGNNELEVSTIALGCMSFSGFYGPSDTNETFACLDHARNHGIDFLDTAEVYGKGLSEELIYDEAGQLLKRARWNVKAAIVMNVSGVDYRQAVSHLKESNEIVREALARD